MTYSVCRLIFWKPPHHCEDFRDRYPITSMSSEYSLLSGGPNIQDRRWLEPWLNLTRLQISSALKRPLSFVHSSSLLRLYAEYLMASKGSGCIHHVWILFSVIEMRLNSSTYDWPMQFLWMVTAYVFNSIYSRDLDIVGLQNTCHFSSIHSLSVIQFPLNIEKWIGGSSLIYEQGLV